MIDLYFWPTTNCYKILVMLEETGIPYQIFPVNINEGDQFKPNFTQVSVNNKIPAITDNSEANPSPISLFESGAILQYLAERSGQLLQNSTSQSAKVMQWLFWQTSGLGPVLGQKIYLNQQRLPKSEVLNKRADDEIQRLLVVLDKQLVSNPYICGEYSIADIACYPWLRIHQYLQLDLTIFPNINRWLESIELRAAVKSAYEIGNKVKSDYKKDSN